ncbi:hypothetical protein NEOLEDRAFT_1245354 [Neolentinus lepideus HHB14362 ss-1]|uniref:Transmembrane protein n=1 Tax=Neolentinus lepideus HHB14362 ss-1 TaxID=1314782 RepID=A0A165NYG9_9AGAM|nr:hypothetical protein NEOLEDRAFT_1245354 [Neolentinus lepideus HHB14362 ss-1]
MRPPQLRLCSSRDYHEAAFTYFGAVFLTASATSNTNFSHLSASSAPNIAMFHRRVPLLIAFVLLLFALHRLIPRRPPLSAPSATQTVTIEGRWKDTRASLGLLPLQDKVVFEITPPIFHSRVVSRIELRRRTSSAEQQEEPELHFTEDALEEPKVSLHELGKSFRAITLAEKASASTASSQGRKKGTG